MRLTTLFIARLRASLLDLRSLLFLLLAIAAALAAVSIDAAVDDDRMSLALVNEDVGRYGQMLTDDLTAEPYLNASTMAKDDALLNLRRGRIEAVLIIKDNYSSSLEAGKFENTLELFSASASGAGITVSEPAINKTIEFWMAEFVRLEAADFLAAGDGNFSDEELLLLEQDHSRILSEKSSLQVASEFVDSNTAQDVSAGANLTTEQNREIDRGPIAVAAGWYAVFCLFYLLISSIWLFDLQNSKLLIRAARSGRGGISIISVSASVSFLLSLVGYLLVLSVIAITFGQSFTIVIKFLPSMLIYLTGALAITLFISSLLTNIAALLFLSPVITFVNAALSGLIYALPEWAVVLRRISLALPGSWLKSALTGSATAWAGGLVCAAAWLLLGTAVHIFKRRRDVLNVSSEAV